MTGEFELYPHSRLERNCMLLTNHSRDVGQKAMSNGTLLCNTLSHDQYFYGKL